MIPPALLNFLAGLAAGAGINMLTSVEGGSNQPPERIVTDSVIWVVVSVFLAFAAHLAETVEREAGLVIDGTLTKEEKRAVLMDEAHRVRWQYRTSLALACVTAAAAIALIPGLKR